MTDADRQIVADILRRELPPGVTRWEDSRALKHSADRGGWTRGGITADSWTHYRRLPRMATAADLNAITEAQAIAFYYERHIEPFTLFPSPLRTLLIDFGVTSTHAAVFRALQQALRDLGLYDGHIDGIPGPKTRAGVVVCPEPRVLYLKTLEYRARYYLAIGFDAETRAYLRSHPKTQLHFVRGWLARCLPFVYQAPIEKDQTS